MTNPRKCLKEKNNTFRKEEWRKGYFYQCCSGRECLCYLVVERWWKDR